MKRIFHLIAIFAGLLAVSCYDDSALRNDMSELSQEVDALRAIVEASENGNVIVSVTEISGGYEIELSSGEKLVIRHGKDGQDGQDGENGQGGSSAFEDVIVSEDTVTFILPDGQEVVIPIRHPLDITFNVADENVYVEGEMLVIEYTITGGTENNRVAVTASGVICDVIPTDANSGYIVAQTYAGSSYVNLVVLVTDGVSSTIFKTVKYVAGVFNTVEGIQVDAEGGVVQVPVQTNMQYEVLIENCNWITVAEGTKAIEVREEYVALNVAANGTGAPRTAEVKIYIQGAQYWYYFPIVVYQSYSDIVVPNEPDVEFTAPKLYGQYFGNGYSEGYNYYIFLTDGEVGVDEDDQILVDVGTYYILDVYSDVAVGDGELVLPLGTYEFDLASSGKPGTIGAQYSQYLEVVEDVVPGDFTSATLTVAEGKIELVAVIGNKTHKVTYEGSLLLTPPIGSGNQGGGGGPMSNLTDDALIISENAYFQMVNYGDYYELGLDNWTIDCFADADTFAGDYLSFEVLTPVGAGFAGEYPSFFTDDYNGTANVMLSVYNGAEMGSIYASLSLTDDGPTFDGEILAPLVEGEMLIQFDPETFECTLEFDGYDDAGNSIVAIVSGTAFVDDPTQASALQKKRSTVKSTKTLRTSGKPTTFVLAK